MATGSTGITIAKICSHVTLSIITASLSERNSRPNCHGKDYLKIQVHIDKFMVDSVIVEPKAERMSADWLLSAQLVAALN